MSNSDDPYIRSTISSAVLETHAAARAKDPTVPPVARPYWIPGGPLYMLGMMGIDRRMQVASESSDDLLLSFIAQDADSRVRHVASRNPNMPRILRDAIRGAADYSPEEASAIWFDVWKTDPKEFLGEHRSEAGLPNVLLARGYFAEDFDDTDTARRWFRAASSIGVQEGHANLARLSAAEGGTRTDLDNTGQMEEGQGLRAALLPMAVSITVLAVIIAFVLASLGA